MTARFTDMPTTSRLHGFYGPGDFMDCVAVSCPANGSISDIAQTVFQTPPRVMKPLLALRDLVVQPFGVKTTRNVLEQTDGHQRLGHLGQPLSPGDYLSFFQVQAVYADEIILGEDDRHLDFRASVFRPEDENGTAYLGTWVRCRNTFGKLYLSGIMPFHRHIVMSMAKNLLSA